MDAASGSQRRPRIARQVVVWLLSLVTLAAAVWLGYRAVGEVALGGDQIEFQRYLANVYVWTAVGNFVVHAGALFFPIVTRGPAARWWILPLAIADTGMTVLSNVFEAADTETDLQVGYVVLFFLAAMTLWIGTKRA